jgi:8-oxo-dGTP diphosphatase
VIRVAAAAIMDDCGRVLVSLRPKQVHQGGLWEFPGGKLEAGEQVQQALEREIHEELGIAIGACQPLIRIPHRYPDRSVVLDVWKVTAYSGEPVGREGQAIRWCSPDELNEADFPAANHAIIRALQLPDRYLITPEPDADEGYFLDRLTSSLQAGIRLVQFRAHNLSHGDYNALADRVVALCHRHAARVLLNADPALVEATAADGVHINGRRLLELQQRPLAAPLWLAVSCHTPQELARAAALGADFAVLSPVCRTASHPQATPLGWQVFTEWVQDCTIPVYALGGMDLCDRRSAIEAGGQGIAAIRALWGPQ